MRHNNIRYLDIPKEHFKVMIIYCMSVFFLLRKQHDLVPALTTFADIHVGLLDSRDFRGRVRYIR
jgi:hypothetical protein